MKNFISGTLFKYKGRLNIALEITSSTIYFYRKKGYNFLAEETPITEIPKMLVFDNIDYPNGFKLFAKIIDYDLSSIKYGMRQRKESFLYSVLEIISTNVENGDRSFILLSTMEGNTKTLRMDPGDLELIFPLY